MEVLVLCPAGLATGGPESLHQIAHEMNTLPGVHARMWYRFVGEPGYQPPEYAMYGVDYVVDFPKDFKGVIIFPEVWGNEVTDVKYRDCITIINWAGVDVYYWNNLVSSQGVFLCNKKTLHLCQSTYAIDHLKKLGIESERIFYISDVLNADFFKPYEEVPRNNIVLYNPVEVKLTPYQKAVMSRARDEGIVFKPIEKMSRAEVIDTMHHAKLYLDLGVFSGRERLPREAVTCGCCIITSRSGTAGYYEDVSIPDTYKFDTDATSVVSIIKRMKYILKNYNACMSEFDAFRQYLKRDSELLHSQCETIIEACKERSK